MSQSALARGRTRLSDLQIHSSNALILLNRNRDRDEEHRSREGYFTKQGIGTEGAGNKRRCWLSGFRRWCTAYALCKAGTASEAAAATWRTREVKDLNSSHGSRHASTKAVVPKSDLITVKLDRTIGPFQTGVILMRKSMWEPTRKRTGYRQAKQYTLLIGPGCPLGRDHAATSHPNLLSHGNKCFGCDGRASTIRKKGMPVCFE